MQVTEAVQHRMRGLPWDARTVEKKLVMVLREWDACHPGQEVLPLPLPPVPLFNIISSQQFVARPHLIPHW